MLLSCTLIATRGYLLIDESRELVAKHLETLVSGCDPGVEICRGARLLAMTVSCIACLNDSQHGILIQPDARQLSRFHLRPC